MIPSLTFTGFSDSGKTELVIKVVAELSLRGYKVATIKHEGGGHGLKRDESSDSARHKTAGAATSIVSSPNAIIMDCDTAEDTPVEALLALLPRNTDIAICEGFKRSSLPKIEVVRAGTERSNEGDENLIAIASDSSYSGGDRPVFDTHAPKLLVDFIEECFLYAKDELQLSLVVDGRPVSTKDHLKKMLAYSARGLIHALKGCENPKEILLRVKYKD